MSSRNIMNIFFHFILFFAIIILILELGSYLLLRKNERTIKGRKLNLFGLLMELDNRSILAIAILLIRYFFIIFSIIAGDQIIYVHFVILLLLAVAFGVVSLSIKNLIFEIISSVAIYFGLVCSGILASYLVDVRFEWYVFVGNLCLIVFMLLYATFFLLRNINDVVSRTKYIRRDRNEDN